DAAPLLKVLEPYLADKDLSQSVNKSLEVLGEDALPLWKKAIESIPEGPKGTFRFYAIEKLGAKSLAFLKVFIDDSKPERLQREAVLALGRMAISRTKPISGAIPLLTKALDLKAEKPRYFATVFFARLGAKGEGALGRLDELAKSSNKQIAKSAEKAAKAIRKALK
ncbi:MAG: hypothetical protein P1V97_31555, partial [Planctomycetota bacterium]|nr:hypothetical protein [Planctomycetota bacterium]